MSLLSGPNKAWIVSHPLDQLVNDADKLVDIKVIISEFLMRRAHGWMFAFAVGVEFVLLLPRSVSNASKLGQVQVAVRVPAIVSAVPQLSLKASLLLAKGLWLLIIIDQEQRHHPTSQKSLPSLGGRVDASGRSRACR